MPFGLTRVEILAAAPEPRIIFAPELNKKVKNATHILMDAPNLSPAANIPLLPAHDVPYISGFFFFGFLPEMCSYSFFLSVQLSESPSEFFLEFFFFNLKKNDQTFQFFFKKKTEKIFYSCPCVWVCQRVCPCECVSAYECV